MTSNNDAFAGKLAITGTRKLYHTRDTDEDADWTIVSGDGDTFKVHSAGGLTNAE